MPLFYCSISKNTFHFHNKILIFNWVGRSLFLASMFKSRLSAVNMYSHVHRMLEVRTASFKLFLIFTFKYINFDVKNVCLNMKNLICLNENTKKWKNIFLSIFCLKFVKSFMPRMMKLFFLRTANWIYFRVFFLSLHQPNLRRGAAS